MSGLREPMQPEHGCGHCEQLRPAEDVRDATALEPVDFVQATLALYTSRLDDYVTATKHYQAMQVLGTMHDSAKAEWGVAEASGKLEQFKEDASLLFLNALRWATERHPTMLKEIMGTAKVGRQV